MNTRELLAEVQNTPGYAKGEPDYTAILGVINSDRHSLSLVISEIPNLINPLDSIDRTVAGRPSTERVARLIRDINDNDLQYIDYRIGMERQIRDKCADFVEQFEGVPEPTPQEIKTLEVYATEYVVEPAKVVRTHKTQFEKSTEILEELVALKELSKLYVEAIIHNFGEKK